MCFYLFNLTKLQVHCDVERIIMKLENCFNNEQKMLCIYFCTVLSFWSICSVSSDMMRCSRRYGFSGHMPLNLQWPLLADLLPDPLLPLWVTNFFNTWVNSTCTCVHTHSHAHTHTHTRTYTHSYIHIHTHSHTAQPCMLLPAPLTTQDSQPYWASHFMPH